MYVWIVWEFTDVMDSVWNEEEKAEKRFAALQSENGIDYGKIERIKLNSTDLWGAV